MSSGARIPFAEALELARTVYGRIEPHVIRAKAAGSLRRRHPTIGDLEFVLEPRMIEEDLFGRMVPDLEPMKAEVLSWSEWVKGGERMWQVTHALGEPDLNVDLYFVHPPAEWGSILAIRTGPWRLGAEAVSRLSGNGTPHRNGHVPGHPTPDEESFFRLAGLECPPPHERDDYWKRLSAEAR